MTIEVGLIPEGGGEKQVLGEVVPGEFISLSDFSTGSRHTLSVVCSPDNKGGLVYEFDNEDFAETPAVRAIPIDMYTEDNLDATIGFAGRYERDVMTETRRKGQLVLTHTPLR